MTRWDYLGKDTVYYNGRDFKLNKKISRKASTVRLLVYIIFIIMFFAFMPDVSGKGVFGILFYFAVVVLMLFLTEVSRVLTLPKNIEDYIEETEPKPKKRKFFNFK